MGEQPVNKNCLSYWFPRIRDAGLPVPQTELVWMDTDTWREVFRTLDGESTTDVSHPFFENLSLAVNKIGIPCFLRTGQGSGKHDWKNTCYLSDPSQLKQHVIALVEWSETVDFIGLPCDVWAVRELLPTIHQMVAPRYGDMPVCREFRFFVSDGEVVCWHPYWPPEALAQGFPIKPCDDLSSDREYDVPADFEQRYECLCYMPSTDEQLLYDLARRAGKAVGGSWSIDIIETQRGWYVTDMAIASQSFHWEGCEKAGQFKGEFDG